MSTTIYGGENPDKIYNLLVSGDRNWEDDAMVLRCVRSVMEWCEENGLELHVVHGGAPGADTSADIAAQELELPCHRYPAPWNRIRRMSIGPSRSAGARRNSVMIERHAIDAALFFHDDLENSKGTKDLFNKVKRETGIEFEHVHH